MSPDIIKFPFLSEINDRIYSGALQVKEVFQGSFDNNWYHEYKNLYTSAPKATPYVKRLQLYYSNNFFGIVSVRPINPKDPEDHKKVHSEVSETYLREPPHMTEDNYFYLKCKDKYDEYGFSISCIPFIMPNPYFGVCAQAAVWISLKILERLSSNAVKSQSIPHIQLSASGHYFSDAKGLIFPHIGRLFRMNNCEAFLYDSWKMRLTDDEMKNIIYAYVESGFPVIIGIDVSKARWWDGHPPGYHSIVLIGHTIDGKTGKINGFIAHDESRFPYITINEEELLKVWDIPEETKKKYLEDPKKPIRMAAVGVPPVVGVGYEEVVKWTLILDGLYKRKIIDKKQFPIRPILTTFNNFMDFFKSLKFGDNKFKKLIKEKHQRVLFPGWMWMLLLYESEMERLKNRIRGIILVDGYDGDILFSFIDRRYVLYKDREDGKIYLDVYKRKSERL